MVTEKNLIPIVLWSVMMWLIFSKGHVNLVTGYHGLHRVPGYYKYKSFCLCQEATTWLWVDFPMIENICLNPHANGSPVSAKMVQWLDFDLAFPVPWSNPHWNPVRWAEEGAGKDLGPWRIWEASGLRSVPRCVLPVYCPVTSSIVRENSLLLWWQNKVGTM